MLIVPVAMLALGQTPAASPYPSREKLAIRSIVPNLTMVPRYGLFELTLGVHATFDNPFDPDDVDVWIDMTAPSGKHIRANAFFTREFSRSFEGGNEAFAPLGDPGWKVRFAPEELGDWSYVVRAKDRSGTVASPGAGFEVGSSRSSGFVRRSAKSPRMFAFADGKPFFAVGENMGWAGNRGTQDYEEWLKALGAAGGNWVRVWMSSWNCALEWSHGVQGDWSRGEYHGVGVYSLGNAWKLDRILDLAEKNGVYTMLCFGTYGEFNTGGYFGEGQWKANPYNVANGGPCKTPGEFWTSPEARKLYKRRLRYIAARYGWRTHIHAWEFWNEVPGQSAWNIEMARYLKGVGGPPADPQSHLVSTSYGDETTWLCPEIDFTMTHHYGTGNLPDHAPIVKQDADTASLFKPHLMAEFGIDWRKSDADYDPNGLGINLHNGMWASVVSGNAGTAMLWYWDNYVHPKNVYSQFRAVRNFTDTVPWTAGLWSPLTIDPPEAASRPETWTDVTLGAMGGWEKSRQTEFILTPFGEKHGFPLPGFLFAPAKPEQRTVPLFKVSFEKPGRLAVHVSDVSSSIAFRFLLDGKQVAQYSLSAAPPKDPTMKPEYEKTELRKEYNSYQAVFHKDYGIDVPAGQHTISIEATDGDWMSIEYFTLTGYRSSRYPQVNVYGEWNGSTAILWAENALHTWKQALDKRDIPPISGCTLTLRNLPDGHYAVEWWDTSKGVVTKKETVRSAAGSLKLNLPELATDVAAKVTLEKGKPATPATPVMKTPRKATTRSLKSR